MASPKSYVNVYKDENGELYDGWLRFSDEAYAVHVGKISSRFGHYQETKGSNDEPDTFDTIDSRN